MLALIPLGGLPDSGLLLLPLLQILNSVVILLIMSILLTVFLTLLLVLLVVVDVLLPVLVVREEHVHLELVGFFFLGVRILEQLAILDDERELRVFLEEALPGSYEVSSDEPSEAAHCVDETSTAVVNEA